MDAHDGDQTPKTAKPALAAAPGSTTVEPEWCPRCGGNGRIHVDWDWSSGVEEHITERCPECDGRGHLDDGEDDEW